MCNISNRHLKEPDWYKPSKGSHKEFSPGPHTLVYYKPNGVGAFFDTFPYFSTAYNEAHALLLEWPRNRAYTIEIRRAGKPDVVALATTRHNDDGFLEQKLIKNYWTCAIGVLRGSHAIKQQIWYVPKIADARRILAGYYASPHMQELRRAEGDKLICVEWIQPLLHNQHAGKEYKREGSMQGPRPKWTTYARRTAG